MAVFHREKPRTQLLKCSFCGKTEREVQKLVAGPKGVHICDVCVAQAAEIMAGKG